MQAPFASPKLARKLTATVNKLPTPTIHQPRGELPVLLSVPHSGRDYPERGDRGTPIEGIESAEATGALVFHAGTALHDGQLVTNGGRILNVVGVAETVADARSAAYEAAAQIDFAGMHFRTDIAANA